MTRPLFAALLVSSSLASAQAPRAGLARRLPDTWSNRATFFVGLRGGVAVPPGAVGLAPNMSLELGAAVPDGWGIGLRALWMNSPPGAPAFGLKPAQYGFGALADVRYYVETIEPLTIYPSLSVGFLAGPEVGTNRNTVLPLFNPALGAKVKLDHFYFAFELGAVGLSVPFVVLAVGFDGDSKLDKERARLRASSPEVTP